MTTRTTFSDETTSGGWNADMRKLRRVTLLARAEDGEAFDWLRAFKRDHLPAGVEAKSREVLRTMEMNSAAQAAAMGGGGQCSVYIADLYEVYESTLGDLITVARPVIPPGQDPVEFVLSLETLGSMAQEWLVQVSVHESVVGHLESLIEVCRQHGAGLDRRRRVPELVRRDALIEGNPRHVPEVLTRVAAAVAGALSPERQTAALEESLRTHPFFDGNGFLSRLLRAELAVDKIYDAGSTPVLERVKEAGDRIWNTAEELAGANLYAQIRHGKIEERESHVELGLQAADIAAGIASREYELAIGHSRARAKAVKQSFARVFLNGSWI